MTPLEKIVRNKDLINLIMEHGYIPNKDQAGFGEIKGALQEIDGVERHTTCSGCISEIVRMANVHLQNYLTEEAKNAKFHTFPKHEPKVFGKKGKK